ncbi:tRNA pseudouridine(38-40) synthase TruA [Paucibacter sp. TC2R-5]|uniref:tRNA pseudouridine(38-40) synthase TruA n=1 Tax=Paucibacter sp. TC2R-5 TaxID=2893555 RepID=UPI0021E41551|nr:tRNA pseudouridine(38-40) synthase TruA [Paucibacter sp. TC2R-5]MCV2361144.1 tRNA pseudouridine(38-40) synthase TruA [Paucibacter sp. TC2R-5]
MRVVLGVSYRGGGYHGWQAQADRQTVQDVLEAALKKFSASDIRTVCAGRTDTGVHGLNQVVHFDTGVIRDAASWVRGTNCFLPTNVAIQWCVFAEEPFHARFAAQGRRYSYVLLESPVRPAIEAGSVGWVHYPLNGAAMRQAADLLLGEHDFSAFRSSECQAASPVKTMRSITITQQGDYWRFDFDGSAFLHHMVRNLMGSLLAVGRGTRDQAWFAAVLAGKDRKFAAPTFPADGLYFVGPYYASEYQIPSQTSAMAWLPGPPQTA